MGIKDAILDWLLDSVRIPTDTVIVMVGDADADRDGYISMRELYDAYRKWRSKA